jgi:hypothetical protein
MALSSPASSGSAADRERPASKAPVRAGRCRSRITGDAVVPRPRDCSRCPRGNAERAELEHRNPQRESADPPDGDAGRGWSATRNATSATRGIRQVGPRDANSSKRVPPEDAPRSMPSAISTPKPRARPPLDLVGRATERCYSSPIRMLSDEFASSTRMTSTSASACPVMPTHACESSVTIFLRGVVIEVIATTPRRPAEPRGGACWRGVEPVSAAPLLAEGLPPYVGGSLSLALRRRRILWSHWVRTRFRGRPKRHRCGIDVHLPALVLAR